ncbi:tRNA-specific 2-thiouridylase mnmA [Metamycoplasma arthritidis]|uniref:tRNA-specific 2-thiouridylase MnmA n=1 Tax=Metamycoplasma arthritidis (strain 158L3-1) TaxID=243272 RepID=MNMA_META1|nr:tRNA 2-thiouridine(34) synthase MnmA [Metamycoplasma arthritidis]B3PM68.1 RecName: Full=tRNA-specific 2-thiouridylase MnmA [Metamycoplasma arthritidis 158L3-1]ACF07120.1 tRNA (5-methylaminomethyl-2-thiouridylate)-methyltransferase [Metamycoplasma arthritidis 158L3-1]VEU78646.1 tRNA-specific 2-thiouridylase mnmA [Metamycoplasma arthritidis]
MAKRVVLGMSGGVDSSVCAYLLQQQGYEVVGLFMRNWDSFLNNDFLGNEAISQDVCPQEQDYADAKEVAKQLNIPLYRVDFIKEYWDHVFSYLIEEYKIGRTPNPDIFCNKYIKFNFFAQVAFSKYQADFIAMGHYAYCENGELFKAKDDSKDQSYFLAQLSNEQLKKVIFPLANLTKQEVREIAKNLNLATATKKDSTGICFIGERKFTKFLENYIPAQPGKIIDIATKQVVGSHIGTMYYTIGQRKGLNLGGFSKPYFVVGHNLEKKVLYVANEDFPEYLLSDKLIAIGFNQIAYKFDTNNLSAKFRYRQKDIPIKLKLLANSEIEVSYNDTEAVTPGQEIVIYDGNKVVGGAIINEVFYKNQKKTYI